MTRTIVTIIRNNLNAWFRAPNSVRVAWTSNGRPIYQFRPGAVFITTALELPLITWVPIKREFVRWLMTVSFGNNPTDFQWVSLSCQSGFIHRKGLWSKNQAMRDNMAAEREITSPGTISSSGTSVRFPRACRYFGLNGWPLVWTAIVRPFPARIPINRWQLRSPDIRVNGSFKKNAKTAA